MSTSRDPEHLHALAREYNTELSRAAEGYGIRTKLIETYRDPAAQQVAWDKGRNEHGAVINQSEVVTWKRPGDSWHNLTAPLRTPQGDPLLDEYGAQSWGPSALAFHRAIVTDDGLLGFGKPLDLIGIQAYKVLGSIAVSIGLRWGGDWDQDGELGEPGENDFTHFEVTGIGTLKDVRAALTNGKQLADVRRTGTT